MYEMDFTPLFLVAGWLIVFFAVAAVVGWVPALWTGVGMIVAAVIRYAGRC